MPASAHDHAGAREAVGGARVVAKEHLAWEHDGRDWPNRQASRFVASGGLRWHVQVAGEGPALLLVHGTGASTHSWARLLPILARHYTVVAPDLPGHGFTDCPPGTGLGLEAMAQGVATLARDLGLAPQLGIGHSAGAAVLARMGLDRPRSFTHIVGINGAFVPLFGAAAVLMPALARMVVHVPFLPDVLAWRGEDRSAVQRLLRITGSQLDDAGIVLYQRLFATRRHVSAALGMMAQWNLPALWRDLDKLDAQLSLVATSGDLTIPATQAYDVRKRVGARCDVHLVRGLGHLAHEEAPDEIGRIVLDCLAHAARPPEASP